MNRFIIGFTVLAAGCVSPVVGAECGDGYTQCGSRCVDLTSDSLHCGACDNACPADSYCASGVCVDHGLGDGGTGPFDGGTGDGGVPRIIDDPRRPIDLPGTPGLNPRPENPEPRCDLGELSCGDGGCVRPDTDVRHCGGCGLACADGEVCAAGSCVSACEAPFAWCNGVCIDRRSDPDNCGGCGVMCGSGVCVDSECRSPLAGHIVIIGHDYSTGRAAMNQIVGNAVLLARERTLSVLTFEGAVSPMSRRGTDSAIDGAVTSAGRSWVRVDSPAAELSYRLAAADVLLIYAQPDLSTEDGLRHGSAWSEAIASFLGIGGTVVILVGGEGAAGGTLPILEGAGLLTSTPTRDDVTGTVVDVSRPSDALAIGVPLSYRAERTSVRLNMGTEDAVVTDGTRPVVLHRTVTP